MKRTAVDFGVPLIANSRLALAFIHAIDKKTIKSLELKDWEKF